MTKTLLVDNGANTIKVGHIQLRAPKIVPNVIVRGRTDRRYFIADQLDQCTDFSSLYYRLPFEKGYLTNWGAERTIWDRVFNHVVKADPSDTQLVVTEPFFNLPAIQEAYDQILFEEYGFQACYRTTAPQLCVFNEWSALFKDESDRLPDACVVVDSGYSFTHIAPFAHQRPIAKGIRRVNVGGKLLTNQLKETVSFRHYDMMEETYIINNVKETCCFVSQDALVDLATSRLPPDGNPILQEYVLPDFTNTTRGHIRQNEPLQPDQQVLVMNNERFMIPEILMHPSDIGMEQAGISETIVQSVQACDPEYHGLMYANILLVGGNANMPGYKDRIEQDLRQLVPTCFDIRIATPADATVAGWMGGQRMMQRMSKSELQQRFVTRNEYLEHGSDICRRKFA
ncbi:actin-related protein 6 [Hesseltinella vesiculosa]|uniref:Actin-like protein ARP6 n=1 Tax=Hesseltinella vesiculosa TaxID=101127 RepID=A0A1X2GM71_9FUNG|nr:actin-related protein 6 [Hesseltinella vesiculosa]